MSQYKGSSRPEACNPENPPQMWALCDWLEGGSLNQKTFIRVYICTAARLLNEAESTILQKIIIFEQQLNDLVEIILYCTFILYYKIHSYRYIV